MKHIFRAVVLACSAAVTLPAYAAMGGMQGMDNTADASTQAAKVQTFMGHGKVNSVNPDAGTVDIAMDAVPALRWPNMSMSFRAQDKTMLHSIKAGAMVNFTFAKDAAGGYVVTRIMPARQ